MQTILTTDINLCAELLLQSELVVFPTETVYGLGAIATDKKAVEKVYHVKNRPRDNPLICHVHSFAQMQEYASYIPEYVALLAKELSPGPISYVLNISDDSPLKVEGRDLERIFRIPQQPQTLELLRLINKPLAGPSSNLSGRPSHTNPQMVLYELNGKIAAVLDGGDSEIGLESTVLECKKPNQCRILRPGAIGVSELRAILNRHGIFIDIIDYNPQLKKAVPGNKYPHYSPKLPLYKISLTECRHNLIPLLKQNNYPVNYCLALLSSTATLANIQSLLNPSAPVSLISIGGNLEEYAHNLYFCLQQLDTKNFSAAYLILDDWPEGSLSRALNNRLAKIGKRIDLRAQKKNTN